MKNLFLTLTLLFTLTSFSQETIEYDTVYINIPELNIKSYIKTSDTKNITIVGGFFIVEDFSENSIISYNIVEYKEFEDNTILYVLKDEDGNTIRATRDLDSKTIGLYKATDSENEIVYFEK